MILNPHTVTVKAETREGAGGASLEQAHGLRCQITPLSQSKAFEGWGIELKRPHLLMADKTESDYLSIGALVSWGARRFKVSSPPSVYDFGNIADHVSVLIEEADGSAYNA